MVAQFGLDVVHAYMRHVQDNAEESVRRVITRAGGRRLQPDARQRRAHRVAIRVDARSAAPSSISAAARPQLDNNFNAPTAVCIAAVLYVFRTLVDDEIPLNAGCLKPLADRDPRGLDARRRSRRHRWSRATWRPRTCITNALYGALGVLASGQCTMNNFTFGKRSHQYYETISGGTGAGVVTDGAGRVVGGFDGTSAVQAHMTNSRLTDPEVLEFRFPVRLESHAIRARLGRRRRWRGGDGAVRRIRFLEPMTASILSNGRRHGSFGLAGGEPGAPGINRVERVDGGGETLEHIGSVEMQPGDVFVIETPGGGGWGAAGERDRQPAHDAAQASRATSPRAQRLAAGRRAGSQRRHRLHREPAGRHRRIRRIASRAPAGRRGGTRRRRDVDGCG